MPIKRLLCRERVRRLPGQFSWLDQRLVRERRLQGCSAQALALYLFLVTVADAQGLSYYADHSVCAHLSIDAQALRQAREQLMLTELIAWQAPLYQVLALDHPAPLTTPTPAALVLSRDEQRARLGGLRALLQAKGSVS
jgi:hypothetical protein